ncbi:hypothetical protein PUN28_018892 [Cardiocondyla obscurior]|uniref:Uncharacterized protein n=1 Tax=Cardiocondyla obscurior TaxID=286306 RepID=A0AAW2ECH7_9HYME
MPTGLHQDYHAAIPDLSPPRSQGSSTGGASSIGDYAPRMYTPPTPPTPHEDEKVKDAKIPSHPFPTAILDPRTPRDPVAISNPTRRGAIPRDLSGRNIEHSGFAREITSEITL